MASPSSKHATHNDRFQSVDMCIGAAAAVEVVMS